MWMLGDLNPDLQAYEAVASPTESFLQLSVCVRGERKVFQNLTSEWGPTG